MDFSVLESMERKPSLDAYSMGKVISHGVDVHKQGDSYNELGLKSCLFPKPDTSQLHVKYLILSKIE